MHVQHKTLINKSRELHDPIRNCLAFSVNEEAKKTFPDYQPVQEAASPISCIGRKPLWLQAEAPPVRSSIVFVDSTSSYVRAGVGIFTGVLSHM